MRVEFCEAVHESLLDDTASIFVTGDLGFNAFEGIAAGIGSRFLNAGVAEQSMIGVAAGMALVGLRPWVYSIAPFVTFRCIEQIRNDVCLHRLPVRIVGNGGGYTYGIMGSTHHALEDLGMLKVLPNLRLYFPCTNSHVKSAVQAIHKADCPTYLRLGISGFPAEAEALNENPMTLTRLYQTGNRATVIGVGHAAQIALNAMRTGVLDADVFGISQFPFDLDKDRLLVERALHTRRVIILDEHYAVGSIGESLSRAFPREVQVDLMAVHYDQNGRFGSSKYHLEQAGLTPERLLHEVSLSSN